MTLQMPHYVHLDLGLAWKAFLPEITHSVNHTSQLDDSIHPERQSYIFAEFAR